MRIYLDVCCINRPFDDQTQDRIRLEAEAVLLVLGHCTEGGWQWVSSEVVYYEIQRMPDSERRRRTQLVLGQANETFRVTQGEQERALLLEQLGFKRFDALHLACAESARVDVLLTTDDRMLRLAKRFAKRLSVRVNNPLNWLSEEMNR